MLSTDGERSPLLHGQPLELKPVLVQGEAEQAVTLPSLPRFSELVQQFWADLPDLLLGRGGASAGGDSTTTEVPRIAW